LVTQLKNISCNPHFRRIVVRLMIYNDTAEMIRPKTSEIRRARSGGTTNFAAVFQKLREILHGRIRAERRSSSAALDATGTGGGGVVKRGAGSGVVKRVTRGLKKAVSGGGSGGSYAATPEAEAAEDPRRKLFIFFMTDGCDTCNSEGQVIFLNKHCCIL